MEIPASNSPVTSGDDENGTISLGGTGDHVLDEITMTWGIDDSDHSSLRSFEFPESDIDGDTTLSLGLELVQNPGIFEGAFAESQRLPMIYVR